MFASFFGWQPCVLVLAELRGYLFPQQRGRKSSYAGGDEQWSAQSSSFHAAGALPLTKTRCSFGGHLVGQDQLFKSCIKGLLSDWVIPGLSRARASKNTDWPSHWQCFSFLVQVSITIFSALLRDSSSPWQNLITYRARRTKTG